MLCGLRDERKRDEVMTVISDATVSTGNPERPLTRDEALYKAATCLVAAEKPWAGNEKAALRLLKHANSLIAYAAELRQGIPVAAQEPAGGTEGLGAGSCSCGGTWGAVASEPDEHCHPRALCYQCARGTLLPHAFIQV